MLLCVGHEMAGSLSESVKGALHAIAARLGIDLVRYRSLRHSVGRRIRLLQSLGVDLVVDVGANEGQYALELRAFGFDGQIISVEPLFGPFQELASAAAPDPKWRAIHAAAGASEEEIEMIVAANRGASSSLLPMLPVARANAPHAAMVGRELVQVRRLDDLLLEDIEAAARPFLKIDVQGYESHVLDGAQRSLPHFVGLQVELQLVPLYQGAPSYRQMLDRLAALDLVLAGLEPGFCGLDGQLLETDGIFVRRTSLQPT